jgi:5-formyltetrahydrofolate cyclo-ligase
MRPPIAIAANNSRGNLFSMSHALKAELRKNLRERLRTMQEDRRVEESRRACELFLAEPVFSNARSLLLYVPLQGELDVRLILDRAISEGKRVALPRFDPETGVYRAFFIGDKPLVPGPFGAMEPSASLPIALNRLDLIVAPGLGFDTRGRRLGRGKGFYDRLLSEAAGVKCGICFDEQILPEIPVEPHDVGVHYVATPSRWLDCRGSTPGLQ